jgi:hypothetical protein
MWTAPRHLVTTSAALALLACAGPAQPSPARFPVRSSATVSVELDIRDEAGLHLVHLGVDEVGIEIEPAHGRSVHRFALLPGEHAVWMQAERGVGRGLVCGNYLHHATRRVTVEPSGSLRVCAIVDSSRGELGVTSLEVAGGREPCSTQ